MFKHFHILVLCCRQKKKFVGRQFCYISRYNCYATSCQKICSISASYQIPASTVLYSLSLSSIFPLIILTKTAVRWASSCLFSTVLLNNFQTVPYARNFVTIFETDCHISAHCKSEFSRMLKTCKFFTSLLRHRCNCWSNKTALQQNFYLLTT